MKNAGRPATRLVIFLTEDDRAGHRSTAEVLLERAQTQKLAGATIWRGIEGFGATGHLRATRLPDLARGLPLVFEAVDEQAPIASFLVAVREIVRGALVTIEPVEIYGPASAAR